VTTQNVIFTLNNSGIQPSSISVPSQNTAIIFLNNNLNSAVTGEFAGEPTVPCPPNSLTLLYIMSGGNPGLTDYVNVSPGGQAAALIWT
jgi:hypothetical protein